MCLFLQHRPQNLGKKKQKRKKTENSLSISKFMQKREKYIFNFEIHTNKSKNEKKKAHFLVLISRVHFLHLKKTKREKKRNKIFSNCKNKHAFFDSFFFKFLSIF